MGPAPPASIRKFGTPLQRRRAGPSAEQGAHQVMKPGAASVRFSLPLDFVLVFLLAAALIWPLFKIKYADKWASIESTFIADARFLKEHWPHPQWQPLWYGGTRFDYVYPPALRYGTAALAKFYPMTEARAYHLYTAFFYCLGIAGVYLFVRVACGSRRAGALWRGSAHDGARAAADRPRRRRAGDSGVAAGNDGRGRDLLRAGRL